MPESWSCGIDEAGRGPIAGPVAAGAVILPPDFPVDVLADSKTFRALSASAPRTSSASARWPGPWAGRATRRSTS